MPRRDAISDEKRKRLMQEHEQLQKLMLQARSSVRRSSMKAPHDADATTEEDAVLSQHEAIAQTSEPPADTQRETPEEVPVRPPKTLTEEQLFQTPMSPAASHAATDNRVEPSPAINEKRPLTETDLFPVTEPPRNSTINVILPKHNAAAMATNTAPAAVEERQPRTVSVPASEPVAPEEEEAITYDDVFAEKRRRPKVFTFMLLVVVAALLGFGGYYFYSTQLHKNKSVAQQKTTPIPTASDTVNAQRADAKTENTTPANTSGKKEKATAEQKPLSDELKSFDNVTVVGTPAKGPDVSRKKTAPATATPDPGLGRYKVVDKAYFHDAPDESTRRKAFIIHWNNAVLTPVEEKNGFVYVVFTNHLGQTSKGWLRKSDLQRVE